MHHLASLNISWINTTSLYGNWGSITFSADMYNYLSDEICSNLIPVIPYVCTKYSKPLPKEIGISNVNTKVTHISDIILYIVFLLYLRVKSIPLFTYIALYVVIMLHKLLAYMPMIIFFNWTVFIFCICPNIWNFYPIGYLYTSNICTPSARYALGLPHFLDILTFGCFQHICISIIGFWEHHTISLVIYIFFANRIFIFLSLRGDLYLKYCLYIATLIAATKFVYCYINSCYKVCILLH